MAEPELIQSQREILREFRKANQQRVQTEAEAKRRYENEKQATEKTFKDAQEACTETKQKAEARYKSEIREAQLAHEHTGKIAMEKLRDIEAAKERPQSVLYEASALYLLEQKIEAFSPTSLDQASNNPVASLAQSAERAKNSAERVRVAAFLVMSSDPSFDLRSILILGVVIVIGLVYVAVLWIWGSL